jgi:hypothetical protein
MPADNEFAARLARIEQRARNGEKAQYAPLPEHPDDHKNRKRSARGGRLFTWMILPGITGLIFAGVFANELAHVLPEGFVATSNRITDSILMQIAASGSETANAASAPVPASESEVSRILLGQ